MYISSHQLSGMRKTHRKSRKGCIQCKQRHIKCNEERPCCGNCERLEIVCSFASSPAPTRPSSTPGVSAYSSPIDVVVDIHPSLALEDLELLHHYVLRTASTFFAEGPRLDIIRDEYIRIGFSKIYLLHAILAISALHLYHQDGSRSEMLTRASLHYNAALRLAQPHIVHLTEDHSMAMFAFSGYISVYAMAEACLRLRTNSSTDPIDEIIACFHLSRGIRAVLGPFYEHLSTSAISPILFHEDIDRQAREDNSIAFEAPLQRLRARLPPVTTNDDGAQEDANASAMKSLFNYLAVCDLAAGYDFGKLRLVHQWLVEAHKDFLDLLDARDPLALAILAHYAVLVHQGKNTWWLQTWPQALFSHVQDTLDESWSDVLEWPKTKIYD